MSEHVGMLENRQRSATVVAVEPVSALALAAADFSALLDEHPRIWAALHRIGSIETGRRTSAVRHRDALPRFAR